MNLLLDTHVFLWVIDDSPRLAGAARAAIVDGTNVVFVSAVTAWEISIKQGIGKLTVPRGNYLDELRLHRLTPLNITTEHALAVAGLPAYHQDPFDRLLVAQAQVEKLTLVTGDARIQQYAVRVLAA